MACRITPKFLFTSALAASLAMAACTPITQTRDVEATGFLGDYSQLKPGNEGEALKIYVNPNYQQTCKTYDKVMIDPIKIWVAKDSNLISVSTDDRQAMVNHLHGAMVSELGKEYTIVNKAQPGTLRIRAAITEAEGSWVALDTLSSFMPQMLVLSKMKELATGTASFVGKASGEVEITDAVTGERIAAAIDGMAGAKSTIGVTGKWDDVNRIFDDWAGRLAYRLANCGQIRPEQ